MQASIGRNQYNVGAWWLPTAHPVRQERTSCVTPNSQEDMAIDCTLFPNGNMGNHGENQGVMAEIARIDKEGSINASKGSEKGKNVNNGSSCGTVGYIANEEASNGLVVLEVKRRRFDKLEAMETSVGLTQADGDSKNELMVGYGVQAYQSQ